MRKFSVTKLNICVSVLHQVFTAVFRLILARMVLRSFGSENNGLMQSVDQILGYTVLLEGGIGGVMRAALYKPLADNDTEKISDIFHSGKRFFGKLSLFFVLFVVALGVGLKLVIRTEFDWPYVFAMVLILGTNTYFSYYSAISHRILLTADQKLYIIQLFQILSTGVNLVLCIVAIRLDAGIHIVKLLTVATALVGPIFFCSYVRKHYSISSKTQRKVYQLPQRRDGVVHYLAYFVHHNTDVVLLSLFSNLENVSVYSVYRAVISVLEQILASISSGIASRIGALWARKEIDKLNETIDVYEVCNAALTFSVGVVCYLLILPFISIYTAGVVDANYNQPVFAALVICGSMAHCLLMPYSVTISAAGHYKQTKLGAIGEVSINLLVSIILVRPLGLVGVAIGTLLAMLFRLLYSVWYLSVAILKRSMWRFVKCTLPNLALAMVLIGLFSAIGDMNADNIGTLFMIAVKVSLVVFPLFAVMNFVLQPKRMKTFLKNIR